LGYGDNFMDVTTRTEAVKKLSVLQVEFRQELPDILADIEHLCVAVFQGEVNKQQFEALYQAIYNLADSAGIYCASLVSKVARELEQALKFMKEEYLQGSSASNMKQQLFNKNLVELKQAIDKWQPSVVADARLLEHKEKNLDKCIYLLADNKALASSLIVNLGQAGYIVCHFFKFNKMINACEVTMPAAIILDTAIGDDKSLAGKVIATIREKFSGSLPVVLISVHDEMRFRLEAVRAGASRYLCKPLDIEKLLQSLDGLLMKKVVVPYRVLLVDNDTRFLEYCAKVLGSAGIVVETLSRPLEGLDVLVKFKPDVVVMDVYMPECSGPELVQVIRHDDTWALTPIIFLSAELDINNQLTAMEYGADDFLVKPVRNKKLIAMVIAMAKRARKNIFLHENIKNVLRESDFQLVTMNQHDIVSTTDVGGHITSVNEKFCEISGYSREELLGGDHRVLKSGYHVDSFYKELWRTISQGHVWHGTICNRKKNGEEYWVESTIVPFLDDKSEPYKYVFACTDVTAFRQGEERLHRSQVFSKIANWDWNLITDDLYWSDYHWTILGYKKEDTEATYDNFINAVHPGDRKKILVAIGNCLDHGEEYNVEHRVVWPDGSEHWVQGSGDVVRSDDGSPLRMLGIIQDISARKSIELELIESEQQLRNAQSLSHIGNWYIDLLMGDIVCSDETCCVFGFEFGSIRPDIDMFIKAIHPDDMAYVMECEDKLRSTGHVDIAHRIIQPDGTIRHVRELCEAKINSLGDLVGITGTVQDITDEMLIKQSLLESREEAEKASQAKSKFLSSMSHELRTPMNAIMGFSQLLKIDRNYPLSELQKDNIDEIIGAGSHLLDLINEVLDLTRIESGRMDLSIETVLISKVVIESLQLITPLAQKRGISIGLVCNGEDISFEQLVDQTSAVKADSTRLKQVLINLLSNAVKYNSENGKITIAIEKSGDNQTRINITDEGAGLTSEQQAQLFIPFNRLGFEQTEVDGAGIGLVITKNIIELMGGKIGVECQPGEGCSFWFELPADNSQLPEENKGDEFESAEFQLDIVKGQKYSVLYIEDNPANLRLVCQILRRRSNINLLSAHEPVLGLELASEHQPDLILLDINLPGMDGYEVLEKLRGNTATSRTPVIAISANAMQKDIKKGIEAGFDDYITKPIDVRTLLSTVDKTLIEISGSADEIYKVE